MTGWKRYLVAIVAGILGAFAWGFLSGFLGSAPVLRVIGGLIIMMGALVWANER